MQKENTGNDCSNDKLSILAKISIEENEYFGELDARKSHDKTSSNLFHNNSSKNVSVLKIQIITQQIHAIKIVQMLSTLSCRKRMQEMIVCMTKYLH